MIAQCALDHYKSLGTKGKPRELEEWTVFAAIIAQNAKSMWVVSSATGSKCTTVGPVSLCLRDMHAEVMAKRGLQRILWEEMKETCTIDNAIRLLAEKEGVYRLRDSLRLHLYISDSPCGDATIYKLSNGNINFTGAKVILRDCGDYGQFSHSALLSTDSHEHKLAREHIQEIGVLRVKSGRSDLPAHLRSTSMSCSDKILRWMILGLQGTAMRNLAPIRLSSVVVSRDPACEVLDQQHALERAIKGRIKQVIVELNEKRERTETNADFLMDLERHHISVHVVNAVFSSSMTNLKTAVAAVEPRTDQSTDLSDIYSNRKRKRDHTSSTHVSPCGFCLNWNSMDSNVEVVVGARGVLQGKKAKSNADFAKLASRLCRQSMAQQSSSVGIASTSYRSWKFGTNVQGNAIRDAVLATRPFLGWLHGNSNFELGCNDR